MVQPDEILGSAYPRLTVMVQSDLEQDRESRNDWNAFTSLNTKHVGREIYDILLHIVEDEMFRNVTV